MKREQSDSVKTIPSQAAGLTPELIVSRKELVQALRTASLGVKKTTQAHGVRGCGGDACLSFSDGCLNIEAGETSFVVPVSGQWPETIFVDANWVRRLAMKLPAGDPLRIRVADDRLYVARYSEPCSREPQPVADDVDKQALILKAAQILKPLRLTAADLEEAVEAARARGPALWRVEDRKMMPLVAEAWLLLAPLGIETSDLRRLVDKAVRDAWKTKR